MLALTTMKKCGLTKRFLNNMQLVIISNRPHILKDTCERFNYYMSFISEILVFVKDDRVHEFKNICKSIKNLKIISENYLLDDLNISKLTEYNSFPFKNHVKINYLLRKKISYCDLVEKNFIMADDDFRPIKKIKKDFFLSDENKYSAFFTSSLPVWLKYSNVNFKKINETDKKEYHPCLISSIDEFILLKSLNFPTFMFASHMPQIINKELFKESVEFFEKYESKFILEEWNTYFNYILHYHRDKVNLKLFETINWPSYQYDLNNSELHDCFVYFYTNKFSFENYYDSNDMYNMYNFGKIFEKIDEKFNEKYQTQIDNKKNKLLNQYINKALRDPK